MLPRLESDRLIIEPLSEAHFDFFVEMGSLMEVMKFLNGRPLEPAETIRELEAHLNGSCLDENLGLGMIRLKRSGEPVGKCNLNIIRDYQKEVHVGYRLHPNHWKQGYALEVAQLLMNFGFRKLELPEIYGITHPDNWASQKVLLKAGMHFLDKRFAYDTTCKFFVKQNPHL